MPCVQVAVIEFCRSVVGEPDAHSEEFDASAPLRSLIFMPEINRNVFGGSNAIHKSAPNERKIEQLIF